MLIVSAGIIKFGTYDEHPYKMHDLPFFLLLGVLGGLLGAFFIFVNYNINKLRKIHLNTNLKRIGETCALVFLTATIIYFAPSLLSD